MWVYTNTEPRKLVDLEHGVTIEVSDEMQQNYQLVASYLQADDSYGRITLGSFADRDAAQSELERIAQTLKAFHIQEAALNEGSPVGPQR